MFVAKAKLASRATTDSFDDPCRAKRFQCLVSARSTQPRLAGELSCGDRLSGLREDAQEAHVGFGAEKGIEGRAEGALTHGGRSHSYSCLLTVIIYNNQL